MNRANYVSVAQSVNGNGCYPLSAQGLEFIQDQILFLQDAIAALIGAKRVILKAPTSTVSGLVLIDGELLPLKPCTLSSSGAGVIRVTKESSDVVADGVTYAGAREVCYAEYLNMIAKPPVFPPNYLLNEFTILSPITV